MSTTSLVWPSASMACPFRRTFWAVGLVVRVVISNSPSCHRKDSGIRYGSPSAPVVDTHASSSSASRPSTSALRCSPLRAGGLSFAMPENLAPTPRAGIGRETYDRPG
jgi:hypothetical protein